MSARTTRTLAELARLLPELGGVAGSQYGAAAFDSGARARLFEAIRQVLLSARTLGPLLLVLDDLQWADASTVEVLIYLARRLNDTAIALLTSWRTENNENTRQLRQALTEAQRAGYALHLVPDRLSAAQVAHCTKQARPGWHPTPRSGSVCLKKAKACRS